MLVMYVRRPLATGARPRHTKRSPLTLTCSPYRSFSIVRSTHSIIITADQKQWLRLSSKTTSRYRDQRRSPPRYSRSPRYSCSPPPRCVRSRSHSRGYYSPPKRRAYSRETKLWRREICETRRPSKQAWLRLFFLCPNHLLCRFSFMLLNVDDDDSKMESVWQSSQLSSNHQPAFLFEGRPQTIKK
ncbi:hypothetical protein ACFX13_010860 [Malus domestica]